MGESHVRRRPCMPSVYFLLLLLTVYITELSRGQSVAYQFQQIMNSLER